MNIPADMENESQRQSDHSEVPEDGSDSSLTRLEVSPKAVDSQDEEHTMCPICFEHENLAMASCQHAFCVPCLERILLSSGSGNRIGQSRAIPELVSPDYPAGRDEDLEQLKIPAWNVCPICRKSMFLWDLRRCYTNDPSKNGNKDDRPSKGVDKEKTTNPTPGEYIYSREPPIWDELPFLRGSVWLESTNGVLGQEGYGSFHFPPIEDDPEMTHAFYNLEKVNQKRLFFTNCFYHYDSRILSAQLVPEDETATDETSYRLVLAFSADGSFVRNGALVVQHQMLTPGLHTAKFPFDGLYTYQDERVTVVGHKCIVNGQPMLLIRTFEPDEDYSDSLNDDDKELFPVDLFKLVTPDRRVVAKTDRVGGVGVGAQLVWQMKGRRTMHWLRDACPSSVTDRLPRYQIHRWGCEGRWLRRKGPLPAEDGPAIPKYHPNNVFGNVFVQGFKVGMASYHFIRNEGEDTGGAYISYEHPSTSHWPPLDNGQPIPSKVWFHHVTFPTPTTFRGHILWQQDFGTSWQGMIRWEYEVHFEENFMCIVGGSVTSFDVHTPDIPRELCHYGEDLVYVNAALYLVFRRRLTDEQMTTGGSSQTWSDSFRSYSLDLRMRLQRQNASVRTIAMAHKILTAAYEGDAGTCPIDYNFTETTI